MGLNELLSKVLLELEFENPVEWINALLMITAYFSGFQSSPRALSRGSAPLVVVTGFDRK